MLTILNTQFFYVFVEQDVCAIPPIEAIAISYKNVKKLSV